MYRPEHIDAAELMAPDFNEFPERTVTARCGTCGDSEPLSSARRLERHGCLIYRCRTCDDALVMVTDNGEHPRPWHSAHTLFGRWIMHAISDLSFDVPLNSGRA